MLPVTHPTDIHLRIPLLKAFIEIKLQKKLFFAPSELSALLSKLNLICILDLNVESSSLHFLIAWPSSSKYHRQP